MKVEHQPRLPWPSYSPFTSKSSSYEDFRTILQRYQETGNKYKLPQRIEDIPEIAREHVVELQTKISPSNLEALFLRKKFGIAEETSDVLFFLILNTALKTGALSIDKVKMFKIDYLHLMDPPSTTGFSLIKEEAKKIVTNTDAKQVTSCFPESTYGANETNEIMKKFLELYLMTYLIRTHRFSNLPCMDFLDEKVIPEWLTGEKGEVTELAKKTKEFDYSDIDWLDLSKQKDNVVNLAYSSSISLAPSEDFDFLDFVRFNYNKCFARTEHIYLNPNKGYKAIKVQAKPWEKLMEANMFLAPTKI